MPIYGFIFDTNFIANKIAYRRARAWPNRVRARAKAFCIQFFINCQIKPYSYCTADPSHVGHFVLVDSRLVIRCYDT